jgi:hypothetical protein
MDCIHLVKNGAVLLKRAVNLQVPKNISKLLSSCISGGFSRTALLQQYLVKVKEKVKLSP